jgi:transposase
MRVLMRCLKVRPPASDLFGVEGRRWLAEQQLPVTERETVDSAVRQVALLDAQIAEVEKLIAVKRSWPEIKRLMTVPAVNVIVAATFMAAPACSCRASRTGSFGSCAALRSHRKSGARRWTKPNPNVPLHGA